MVIAEGQLKGSIYGFRDQTTVFEFFGSGQKWRQTKYQYHYHYAYMPRAKVVLENGRYMLHVEGISFPLEVTRA